MVAVWSVCALLCASANAAGDTPNLSQKVAEMAKKAAADFHGVVGAHAVSLADRRELVAVDADRAFLPASNEKIVTSAVALATLGGKFEFVTRVYVRDGDVIVAGDYDPTLGDPLLAAAADRSIYADLDAWSQAVVKALAGKPLRNVCLVSNRPVDRLRHEDWPVAQYQRWHAAPAASLNFHDNCFDVTFRSQAGRIEPAVSPASQFIQIVNGIKTGPRQLWTLKGSADLSSVQLAGTVKAPNDTPLSVAIDDPLMLLGRVLADRLVRAGATFSGQVQRIEEKDFDPKTAVAVAQTRTPLPVVMSRANKRSLNFAAECLFLRATGGDWESGARLAEKVLREQYHSPDGAFIVADGSGFSRRNRVVPSAMTDLLAALLRRDDGKIFLDSLPISGVDGSLDDRLDDALCKGRVLGKTGTLAGVSGLSGYILDKSGKPAVAFSILINEARSVGDGRNLEDAICRELLLWVDESAATSKPATPHGRP